MPVRFAKGDAVCMIQPFALDLLEQFDCSVEPFAAAPPEIQKGFDDFVQRRSANIAVAPQGQYESQRDYFAGRYPDGSSARYPLETENPDSPVACPVTAPAPRDTAPQQEAPHHRTGFALKPFENR